MSIKCPHCTGLISLKVETAPKSHYKNVTRFAETPGNILAFINHVKTTYIGYSLTISELVKIYSEFIIGSKISPIRLGTFLAETGEFPRSKVTYRKGAKSVRLYHIH